MATLATIDSGANAGGAIWQDGTLVYATLIQAGSLIDWQTRQISTERTWVELPIYYPGKSKVDANDLIKTGFSAGRLAPGGEVETIWPVTWKGNLPDRVLYNRIRLALTSAELELIPKLSKSLIHNVWDAIGIGLHVLGRMPRTIVLM